MRPVVPLDAVVAFLDAANESAGQDILAVGREGMAHCGATTRPEWQAFEMLVLREPERYAIRPCRHGGFRVADGHVGDAQRNREVTFQEKRRRREDFGDVIEAEVAAVARQ